MIRLLSSFLTNRHLRVHHDNAVSNKIELKAGTPQDSALQYSLYSMLMIPQNPHKEFSSANLQMTWPPGPFRSKKRELKKSH